MKTVVLFSEFELINQLRKNSKIWENYEFFHVFDVSNQEHHHHSEKTRLFLMSVAPLDYGDLLPYISDFYLYVPFNIKSYEVNIEIFDFISLYAPKY